MAFNVKLKRGIITVYFVFLLVTTGFIGFLVFEGIEDEGGVVAATTRYVGGTGMGNYSTIQAAINAANSGDTIRVYAGTYYENVIVDKTVTLIGNGTTNTTIDSKWSGDVVNISADWVNITGFTVTNSGSGSYNAGIELNNVRNCCILNNNVTSNTRLGIFMNDSSSNTLVNNTCNSNTYGIYLDPSSNNIITNNTCNSNKRYGVVLFDSSNNTIANNTCNSNNHHGIALSSSSSNTITNNTCSLNNYQGILLSPSSNNTLANNTCNLNKLNGILLVDSSSNLLKNNTCNLNNESGIKLYFSSNITLANNTCNSNNKYSIYLSYSSNNTLANNTMNSCGLYIMGDKLTHWNTHIIDINNTVNGKPVYYWRNVTSGKVLAGAGQVILANCTNVTVENQNVSDGSMGIELGFSTANTIKNNTCDSNYNSIYLCFSSNNTIVNNSCNSNNCTGIILHYHSNKNLFFNNTIKSNYYNGMVIKMNGGENNKIKSNIIRYNDKDPSGDYPAIALETSYNEIIGNIISYNKGTGIYLQSAFNSIINNNTCNSNGGYGICLLSSSNSNKIINCSIYSNSVKDFDLMDNSKNNNAINTTFNTISVDSTSSLIVKNYLHIQINDSSGSPIKGADVEVKDGGKVIYATSGYGGSYPKTNTIGQIEWILVTDRIYTGSSIAKENTTIVNVKYASMAFKYNNRNVNMFTSHFEYFNPNYLPTKVILKGPTNNSFVNDSKPELKWKTSTDPDDESLTYHIEVDEYNDDWSSLVASFQTATGILSWNISTSLIDGQTYQWRVCAHDGHNNGAWSNVWKFTVDTLAPLAPIDVSATPKSWTNKNLFSINWTNPSDTSGVVTGAYYKLDLPPTSSTDGTWVEAKPITGISVTDDGDHKIYIWLKDNLGNINHLNYNTTTLFYDSTPPEVPVINSTTHPRDTWTNNNNPQFNWVIIPDLSEIAGYSYILDQNPTTTPDTTSEGTSTDISYTNKADGEWYFHIRAKDNAGNWGPAAHYKIKIDMNSPSSNNAYITIDGGSEYSNDYILNLKWGNFIDINGSGIAGYYYSLKNNEGTSDGTWTTIPKGVLTAAKKGETTVYVWAKDNVGNIGLAASASIIIKFPTVIDLELSNETVYRTQNITFTSNCSEPCDPVNKLECQFQYKYEEGTWQDLIPTYIGTMDGYWQAKFTPLFDSELGLYYVRVKYTNLNGTSTDWTMKSFTVLNNPPIVLNPIADFSIQEDHSDSTTVNLNTVFYDVDSTALEFSEFGSVRITVMINPDGSVEFIPKANWSGIEFITFSASDGIAEPIIEKVKVTIIPVNDKPLAIIDTQIRASILGQKLTIEGHGVDIDGTITEYSWISDIDGELSTSNSFDTSGLSQGEHNILFSVKDNDGAWSQPVTIFFKVTAPDLVITDIELSSDDITEGDKISITVTINNQGDADVNNINVIFYDGDKEIGSRRIKLIDAQSSERVSITWQPAMGDHSIRVHVITEDKDIIESNTENNQISKSLNVKMYLVPLIIIIIIIIVIFLIILMLIYRAKRIRKKDLETISEMEAQLEKAKEMGLPTKDLEQLLKEAKELRETEKKEGKENKKNTNTKKNK